MNEGWVDIYKLQYERIAQHENQRLIFSNIVVVISTAILALFIKSTEELSIISNIWLAMILVFLNAVASIYIKKSRSWIKFHQNRARKILKASNPEIMKIYEDENKPDSDQDKERRPNLQIIMHLVIVFLGLAIIIISSITNVQN
ncbi:hypothetical protein [Pseudoalteromonas espejiana]|uniref:Uncharacterized protein n=1 Tax=Pseudoalteromonas espejiana TaxID=28107 RepID=A0A510XVD7_9GAMM|nr:hypothetical protein [Pseudoalteromonas espejiana]GEK54517.1 hypothetical protein PES01_13620 [Pseudoalteromonas espejiana]